MGLGAKQSSPSGCRAPGCPPRLTEAMLAQISERAPQLLSLP